MNYDYLTRNTSAIIIVGELRKKGIGNKMFPVSLNNQKLVGIDPHSDSLTDEQKDWIVEECKNNFWYFIREVVRLPHPEGPKLFRFNLMNTLTLYALHEKKSVVALISPRQTGKKTISLVLQAYDYIIDGGGLRIGTHDPILIQKLGEIIERLPSYLPNVDNYIKSGEFDMLSESCLITDFIQGEKSIPAPIVKRIPKSFLLTSVGVDLNTDKRKELYDYVNRAYRVIDETSLDDNKDLLTTGECVIISMDALSCGMDGSYYEEMRNNLNPLSLIGMRLFFQEVYCVFIYDGELKQPPRKIYSGEEK